VLRINYFVLFHEYLTTSIQLCTGPVLDHHRANRSRGTGAASDYPY